jgi:hypothetical protein
MPQIILQSPGQPVADFSVSGALITVAGVTVDCAAEEADTAKTVEIRIKNGRRGKAAPAPTCRKLKFPPGATGRKKAPKTGTATPRPSRPRSPSTPTA